MTPEERAQLLRQRRPAQTRPLQQRKKRPESYLWVFTGLVMFSAAVVVGFAIHDGADILLALFLGFFGVVCFSFAKR